MKKVFLLLLVNTVPLIADNKVETEAFDKIAYEWSRTFAEVLQLTKQKYYNVADLEKAMTGAISGLVSNLGDAHSDFWDQKTYKSMMEMTSGQFYGIGVMVDNLRKPKDKFLTIVDTIPDGPADKAGIKPMDKVIEVDGMILEGKSTEEIIGKIKGERNTKVTIKVLREGHPDLITLDIVRDVVKEQNSLNFHIKDHGIYYISLATFSQGAFNQIEKVLKNINSQNYNGIIFDLRNNSGGLLSAAIDIAGLFLDKGTLVVTTRNKDGNTIEEYRTQREPISQITIPIIILINNYTASAAEILTASLKKFSEKRSESGKGPVVLLVGTSTFGKGSVQEVIPLSNHCAMKLTTALYFPENMTIQGVGIKPDVELERMLPPTEQMQWFLKHYGREKALANTIKHGERSEPEDKKEEPNKTAAKTPRWVERAQDMLKTDNQLREAINIINFLDVIHALSPDLVSTRSKALNFLKTHHIVSPELTIEEVKL